MGDTRLETGSAAGVCSGDGWAIITVSQCHMWLGSRPGPGSGLALETQWPSNPEASVTRIGWTMLE